MSKYTQYYQLSNTWILFKNAPTIQHLCSPVLEAFSYRSRHIPLWFSESMRSYLIESQWNNYRLITAYLLLRVNLDKIMHARWDFDASSAQTRRVSALDKHQNWSASALFCLNSRAQSKYAVVDLIHTRHKTNFFLFYYVINKTF